MDMEERCWLSNQAKPLSVIVIVFILWALVAACGGGGGSAPTPTAPRPATGDVRPVSVTLRDFVFTPRSMSFTVGETVEFDLTSVDEAHNFTVKELGIEWDVWEVNETQTERFTFTRAGEFKLVCTVPGHEALGMVGRVTVE